MNYLKLLNLAYNRFFHRPKETCNDYMIFPCGMSRSGTTLLSAIFDSHSQICMGYEMLFPSTPSAQYIIDHLAGFRGKSTDLRLAGSILRKQGIVDLGKWISRCHRLGLDFDALQCALEQHIEVHGDSLKRQQDRLLLIKRLLSVPKVRGESTHLGFKITDDAFDTYLGLFPNALFVYILRDPRDVYASLQDANFSMTLSVACARWNQGLNAFVNFQKRHPDRCHIIRYEDVVLDPQQALTPIFKMAGLEIEEGVLEFQLSNARILRSSHPNAENLKKGFFNSSIARYLKDLSMTDILDINNNCRELMCDYGYLPYEGQTFPNSNKVKALYSIPRQEVEKKIKALSAKAKFREDDYTALLKPYVEDGYEVMTLLEFTRKKEIGDRKILVIRHDIDHNHLTAMKMAKWEHAQGIRSSYCPLHTTWYYGRLENGTMRHSTDLVYCVQFIAGLGHEITLHNNLVVTALKENIDPVELLKQELDFFDSIGISIKGTSSHGDSLCRDLNFRNYEIFREMCGRYGEPRTILYEQSGQQNAVNLGEVSMFDFGLEYEAYEIFWDIYHSDSGGHFQTKLNRNGMRHFGRTDKKRGSLVGVLTHPVWWQF